MRVLRKKGNIWVWAAVGMIAGPWALNGVRSVTGVGIKLPKA